MAQKQEIQSFTQSWNQTAAWAQAQGIPRKDYYPIYQMDSTRLLTPGSTPMSQAERTRAILAAHNPNQVTPVPGDKPNPTNIVGNAVTDLRNIFTGLAPNHLIPNIFDTVKNTILHPATVIKPLGEIIGGVASGNVNEVKSGFEQAAGLTGPGSILSWLPGVYVGGEFAQGGLSEVLSRPVTSFIDLAPFAPAGRIIDAAANASRAASVTEDMAAKVGMTPEQFRNASLPGMLKSYALTRKVGDVPFLKSRVPSLVNGRNQPITIGSALDRWITAHTGMGKTLSALMKGMLDLNHYGTAYELAVFRPAQMAMDALGPGAVGDAKRAEAVALLKRTDPRTKGKTPIEIQHDESIEPAVRTAYAALEDARSWDADTAMATGAAVAQMRDDGTVGVYGSYGQPSEVLKTAKAAQDAQDALIKEMEPSHRLTLEIASWDAQAATLAQEWGATIPAAEQAAYKLEGQRRQVVNETPRKFGTGTKVEEVKLDIKGQIDDLFGKRAGLGEVIPQDAGLMGQIKLSLDQRNYANVRELTGVAKRRLDLTNFKLREGRADDPALIKLSGQIDALHSYAAKRMEYEQKFLANIEGEMKTRIDPETGRRVGGASQLARRGEGKTDRSTIDPAVQRRYDKAKAAFDKDLTSDAARQEFEAASRALREAPRIPGKTRPGKRETSKLKEAFAAYRVAQRAFAQAVWDHPTADWMDLVQQKVIEEIIKQEERRDRFGTMTRLLREEHANERFIKALNSDPVKMAQFIEMETRRVSDSPWGEQIMTQAQRDAIERSAKDAAEQLRAEGHEVVWIPSISTLDKRDWDSGRYGVHLSSTGQAKRSSRGFDRTLANVAKRYDVMAGIHQATKEALQIRQTIEFVDRQLTPHFIYADEAARTIRQQFPDVAEHWNTLDQNAQDALVESVMRDNFNLVQFNPHGTFGFTLPRWKPGNIYLPKEIADALPKMLNKGQFPLDGAFNKATNLFRFSILGLSPRYTAHVTFGGTFLLALRSSPYLLTAIPDAWKLIHDEGAVPRETIERNATQYGADPVHYMTFHDGVRGASSRVFHTQGGADMARLVTQEHIELKQGIKLAAAQPVHWLKAIGETNLKFTNAVANFQRALAFSDYLMRAKKGKVKDPITGEKLEWTDQRVRRQAEHHVAKTLGDLQNMTPLERATFTKLMPFYGWTKHILEFTGSYPVDHPFRASALTVLANQDSNDMALGIPKRLQFLFFLGSPDAAGNVSAMDVRFMDPLRDVANYATIGGWIASMNPILSAPIAMIDPQASFGGVPLYPNVTYDQFYGIETASAQGSPLTAIEGVVPQVSALDAALGISAQYRQLAQRNPNGFAKAIFQSLNVPFAQVQHLNLKQIAAKNELDRYQVAKQAATNAFDSGDFSAISGLSSVPDPLNSQWDVTPGSLQALYNQLLTEYPGTPPSSTALPPPSAPL